MQGRRSTLFDSFANSPGAYKLAAYSGDVFLSNVPLPPEPTDAPPGSSAKIEVLTMRAAARVQLHHPDDLVLDRERPSPGTARVALRELVDAGGAGHFHKGPEHGECWSEADTLA
jgi:hypothetical protein